MSRIRAVCTRITLEKCTADDRETELNRMIDVLEKNYLNKVLGINESIEFFDDASCISHVTFLVEDRGLRDGDDRIPA